MKNISHKVATLTAVTYVVLFAAWIGLRFVEEGSRELLYWGATYQVLAIIGAVSGMVLAIGWGGYKSVMGKMLIAFSLGAFLQTFGQTTFSIYNLFLKTEIPYPSVADIGYFGSIPLYIIGTIYLAKASGVKVSLRSYQRKIFAIGVPVVMLIISYVEFLRDYSFEDGVNLRVLLDFGYPFGQAVYVSVAILTLSLTTGVLGGLMRKKILALVGALIVQYAADFNFLFQALQGTWVNGGYGDLIYMTSYFLLAMTILQFNANSLQQN